MRRLISKRPSPALVIACLALAVALGGTSYAAVSIIPAHSVGTLQLKTAAVGNLQLKNNAVTSAKVANGSLLSADFAAGQIPAGPQGPAGAAGAAGAAGPPGPTNVGATLGVKNINGADFSQTSSTGFTDLASTTIEVPAGSTATLVATFTAESACYNAAAYCGVRINVDGNEATPSTGSDFAFDSSDSNAEGPASWESHAVVRYATGITAGNHTVTVQFRTNNAAAIFRLDDWVLSIVAYKQ